MKKLAWILAAREEEQTFTREKAAKKRAWFWMTVVGIVWLLLYYNFLMKVPFYAYMNLIPIPENCTDLETNVIITDLAYGWHIEAERLIYSSQGEEAIEDYINENNIFSKRIVVNNFYESNSSESDGFSILIPSEKYPCQEQDAENYISLRYYAMYNMFDFMFVLGIVFMVVLCWLTYRLDLHLHKKTRNKEKRNVDRENSGVGGNG